MTTLESAAAPKYTSIEDKIDRMIDALESIDDHKEKQEERDKKLLEFMVDSHAFIVKKENQASRATWMQVVIGVVALGLATASLNSESSVTEIIRYTVQKVGGLF